MDPILTRALASLATGLALVALGAILDPEAVAAELPDPGLTRPGPQPPRA